MRATGESRTLKVAIVGAGVLGTALGVLLRQAGYRISAVSSLNRRSAQAAVQQIGEGEVVGDPAMAALGADIVLLTVPDRAIAGVAIQVTAGGALRNGAIVAHCAGGLSAGILSGVRAAGGHRGAIHPLQSFADIENATRALPRSYYFLEGDARAIEVLRSVVVTIGGRPVEISSGDKALYHAGAAAASNFVVAIVDYAVRLLAAAGVPHEEALPALLPLIRGTVRNLETVGLPEALTGPIARGDLGTVRSHLRALGRSPGDLSRLYRHLARTTVDLALRKGGIDAEQAREMLDELGAPDGDSA